MGCVIPCYNLGRFVETAVVSAMDQTSQFDKIIVIDDGSTDDSWEIIQSLPDGITKIHTENQGYALTRNYGASLLETDYLVFLDADDWLYSNYAWETKAAFGAYIGVVCPQVEAEGVTVAGGIWPAPSDDSLERLWQQNYVWAASAIRRKAFNDVKGFRPELEPAADWGLWVALRQADWRIKGLHQPLWHWRDRPDGLHMQIRDEEIREKMKQLYLTSPDPV